MAREVQVTFDGADPAALATFWAEVLGYVLDQPPPGSPPGTRRSRPGASRRSAATAPARCTTRTAAGPRLFFQQVPEGKTAKNRVHLDVRAAPGLEGEARMAALETEAARLVALGAVRVERFEPGGINAGHLVMHDPEGNEFCLD